MEILQDRFGLVVVILAVALLAFGGYILADYFTADSGMEKAEGIEVLYRCRKCDHVFTASSGAVYKMVRDGVVTDENHIPCPKCGGSDTAGRAIECPNCQTVYLRPPEGVEEVICPECGVNPGEFRARMAR